MCGFSGSFGNIDKSNFSQHMSRVSEILSRRGPDQINSIDIENFLAFHSRLIVQGNENDGIQPMHYEDIVILFNGNLYNKESLKLTLESKGYVFNGISDTEVVAASIHQWGNLAFEKFNGFFSIVSFNTKSKSLTLARDRLGQKPMYYLNNGKSVFFGSTEDLIPKNFLQSTRKESFIDFIVFGFIPSPHTMFENLFSVNPGSYVEFSLVEERIISSGSSVYWKPMITNEINDLESAIELISDSMGNSTEEGLDASIDVACLFSGGVDSSLILSEARHINEDICAFTADFGGDDDAELRSKALAKTLGHNNHLIKQISSGDVDDSLNKVSSICESPFDDTSVIPSHIVFSSVKKSGYSVALTGDGADELFCGYSSFGNLKKIEGFLDKKFDLLRICSSKILGPLLSKYSKQDLERFFMTEQELLEDLSCNGFKMREWGDAINTDYDPLIPIRNIICELDGMTAIDKLRILNLKFKLPYQMLYKVDRASMYNSVEARPLFLHNMIVDSALRISSSVMLQHGQKTILKEIYQSKINDSGWSLPKTGFGWKTNDYHNIFKQQDNENLINKTGIDGLSLLQNRKRHHKRGFYGLFSLNSWLNKNGSV